MGREKEERVGRGGGPLEEVESKECESNPPAADAEFEGAPVDYLVE